jgi:hypothetical protein
MRKQLSVMARGFGSEEVEKVNWALNSLRNELPDMDLMVDFTDANWEKKGLIEATFITDAFARFKEDRESGYSIFNEAWDEYNRSTDTTCLEVKFSASVGFDYKDKPENMYIRFDFMTARTGGDPYPIRIIRKISLHTLPHFWKIGDDLFKDKKEDILRRMGPLAMMMAFGVKPISWVRTMISGGLIHIEFTKVLDDHLSIIWNWQDMMASPAHERWEQYFNVKEE